MGAPAKILQKIVIRITASAILHAVIGWPKLQWQI
jgi:hypothetical protein